VKLCEIVKQPYSQARIEQWLNLEDIKNYTIRPDGIVDVNGSVHVKEFKGTTLPIQFGNVAEFFSCRGTYLTSLQGMPSVIGGSFNCENTHISSLSGIDKIIKHIGKKFACRKITTHILGLLLIEGIILIDVDGNGPIDKIMNKYVGTGDILSAQDELINAGLIDQARL
jgi:hypothetical protein